MAKVHIDVVIKFGGSAITDKKKLEVLDVSALTEASKLVSRCLNNNLVCVVVHGAGSFGHHQAKQYGVQNGWTRDVDSKDTEHVKRVKHGFCLTRKSVTKLQHLVVESLINEDIPAVAISCCGRWKTNGGAVVQHDVISVTHLLQSGFLPVLHGDCVTDDTQGCSILSGDTIIQTICEACDVDRVVFLASVDGVYDKPPDIYTDSKLLKKILVNTQGKIAACLESEDTGDTDIRPDSIDCSKTASHDVTGGMSKKLESAINIVTNVRTGCRTKVYVCKIGYQFASEVCVHGHTEKLKGLDGTIIEVSD